MLELDDVAGADICTVSALYALGNVNACEIVLNNDCVCRTFSLALHAADTTCFTNLINLCALVHAAACDHNSLIIGYKLNELLGAGIDAAAAADALFAVDLCNTVNNVHSAELASICTVAETDTCKTAIHVALAAEQHSCLAVLGSLVVEALKSMTLCAGARNKCYHLCSTVSGNAHDLADLLSSFGACCNTLVYRSLALCYCSSIAVAAGEAAAAAVCAGQACTDLFLLGVYFNIEYFRCKCKYSTEKSAENAENDNSINNRTHIIALLIKISSCR